MLDAPDEIQDSKALQLKLDSTKKLYKVQKNIN
jgi:hypothetical protein